MIWSCSVLTVYFHHRRKNAYTYMPVFYKGNTGFVSYTHPITPETQPLGECSRIGGCGACKTGPRGNYICMQVQRQHSPGQPLDRFPASPSLLSTVPFLLTLTPHPLTALMGGIRARVTRPSATRAMHRDVQVSREDRMPVVTAAVEPTGKYVRRVSRPWPGCRISPPWPSFRGNQLSV
jgi:hypothetical protein